MRAYSAHECREDRPFLNRKFSPPSHTSPKYFTTTNCNTITTGNPPLLRKHTNWELLKMYFPLVVWTVATFIHHLYPVVSEFPIWSVSTHLHHRLLPVQQSPGTCSVIPTDLNTFDNYLTGNDCVEISPDWTGKSKNMCSISWNSIDDITALNPTNFEVPASKPADVSIRRDSSSISIGIIDSLAIMFLYHHPNNFHPSKYLAMFLFFHRMVTGTTISSDIVTGALPAFTIMSEISDIMEYKDPKAGLIKPFQDVYLPIYYPHCKFVASIHAFELRIYAPSVWDLHDRPISSHYINLPGHDYIMMYTLKSKDGNPNEGELFASCQNKRPSQLFLRPSFSVPHFFLMMGTVEDDPFEPLTLSTQFRIHVNAAGVFVSYQGIEFSACPQGITTSNARIFALYLGLGMKDDCIPIGIQIKNASNPNTHILHKSPIKWDKRVNEPVDADAKFEEAQPQREEIINGCALRHTESYPYQHPGLYIRFYLSFIVFYSYLAKTYYETFKKQNWEFGKRTEVTEYRRRSLTVGLWFAGFVATILSAIPCYEPELFYSMMSHTAVAVDAVATSEGITAMIALFCCRDWKKQDLILLIVRILGSIFSLLSSVGGLGESRNALVHISDWKFGGAGFLVATVVRTVPVELFDKLWELAIGLCDQRRAPVEDVI